MQVGTFNASKFLGKKVLFGLAAAVLLATPAHAEVTTYNVDAKASKLEWMGSKVTGSSHNGTIAIGSGTVKLDGDKLVGGDVTVDMKTIVNLDLTDAKYNKKLVDHLSSEDFFDVAKFPTSKLVLKEGSKGKDGKFTAKGDLTMKSATKPVDFIAAVSEGANGAKTVTVDLTVDRTVWDVRYGSGKFFKNLGDKMIKDEINLKATIVLTPAAKTAQK